MRNEAEALGRAIREVREGFGLSQEELAAFAGVNRTSLGEIERGETNPGFDTLCRIASAVKMPLSELIRIYERQSSKRTDS